MKTSGIVGNGYSFTLITLLGLENERYLEIGTKFGSLLKIHSSSGLHQYTATLLNSGLFN